VREKKKEGEEQTQKNIYNLGREGVIRGKMKENRQYEKHDNSSKRKTDNVRNMTTQANGKQTW
jgi:hypothetical protein